MGNLSDPSRLALTSGVFYSLSYVPLIAPSTSDKRIGHLAQVADSFIYVVSKLGVTGASSTVNVELPNLVSRIRRHTDLPLAVGFGVSNREQFQAVGAHADGVVIGSKIITVLRDSGNLARLVCITGVQKR